MSRAEANRLTRYQQFDILKLLEQVCSSITDPEDGKKIAVYEAGWHDDRVAQWASDELEIRVIRTNVQSLRREFFGDLAVRRARKGAKPGLKQRMASLEQRVTLIEQAILRAAEEDNE